MALTFTNTLPTVMLFKSKLPERNKYLIIRASYFIFIATEALIKWVLTLEERQVSAKGKQNQ